MRFFLGTILAVAGALAMGGTASAATFTVNSTGQQADVIPGDGTCLTDQGTCTLRAALGEANALLGADVVNVPAGSYPVTTWAPSITQSLTLTGTAGARQTKLDAGGTAQSWTISGGGNVTIEGLTFTGSNGPWSAVTVNGPDTTFRDVSIEENRATSADGAGLRIQSSQVTMTRSAVTGNLADRTSTQSLGGGIVVTTGGSLTLVASTVGGNRIQSTGTNGWGGGIYSAGQLVMRHVTLIGNSVSTASAANYGGNLYVGTGSQASIRDSIVIDGSTTSGQSRNCGIASSGSTLTVTGKNVYEQLGNFSCEFPPATLAGSTAGLTALADHGGTGLTAVPLTGSVLVDAASGCPDGGRDQRGVKAPTGAACDIGAAELGADLRTQLTAAPGPVAPGTPVFQTVVVSNAGLDTATGTKLVIAPASGLSILSVSEGSCAASGQCSLGTLAPGMSRTVTFSIEAPASGPLSSSVAATSDVPDPTPADATSTVTTDVLGAPVISRLRATGKLRSGSRGKIGFELDRDASVRIVVSRLIKGKRIGRGKCRAKLKKARKGKRCTVVKPVGTISASRPAGPSSVVFPKRLGGRKLTPGRYRLVATATSAEGQRSASVRATVKVLKARKRQASAS